ncbi:MAG: GH36-type glycosyl hydrolase domain-containing protein [Phycisphaerae bacterium]
MPVMDYGHFSEDGREFVITNPFTPRAWHNYLVNDVYLANLTQFGTGASFYQPTGEGLRVNVTEDADGNGGPRFVYLRDNDTGEYWSLTGAPDHRPMDGWKCRVGTGYQINESENLGIAAQWRMFVPDTDDPLEMWTVTLTNNTDRPRRISAFPYIEMHLTGGSTLMDFISVLAAEYDAESNAVFGYNRCVKFPPTFKCFLASDAPVAGATAGRDAFLGSYRDYHNPLAVERGDIHSPEAGTEWLGASLRHEFEIPPGESVSFNCAIGTCSSTDEGRDRIASYLTAGRPQQLFEQLKAEADALSGRNAVQTPDAQFDRWMNVRLKWQTRFVARWGRVIGRGFRDILQDCFAHRLIEPDRARACLLETFSKQFPDGRCIRAWRLPNAELDLQDYADSPSWMAMALDMYLKETADFALLDEDVPFLNAEDPYAAPTASASVWEHVLLAQRHLLADRGDHGLSRIHYGDWCDTMNGVGVGGRGESVMLSMQVKWGCDLLAELAERLGKPEIAEQMRTGSEELARAINQTSWDGDWYVRAFDDDGKPVGSSSPQPGDNGEGIIFLNPQSWSVIAGVATPDRAEKSLTSAAGRLDTGYGMVLHGPPFTALRPRIGQMTAMSPGLYENASVYVHGNCFWIHALAVAGRGGQAWAAMRAILPDTDNKPDADTEPFAVPNFYIGPACPRRAQQNLYLSGWRTGSAAWLYVTAMEWILGLRAEYDGLRIDPHLPDGWTHARVSRNFRGDVYDVTIENPTGGEGAVREVHMDGKKIDGTLIPPAGDGKTHTVRVVMG